MILDSTSVLVPADVCARLSWLADLAKRAAARDATPLHADVVAFLDEVQSVGRAYRFHAAAAVASAADGISAYAVDPVSGTVGFVDIATAAQVLGCRPRNARDLVERHDLGRKVGRAWLVDVVALDEFARGRKGQA